MFNSNLRLVPWKNKAEWVETYKNAYSGDSNKQAKACQTMEIWLLLRRDVPPGVECTLNILSALQQESLQAPRQLQLILSTAVLRVVNMLCDNARQSDKETIYSIAKYFNLPDWVVNLRHDVSHGSTLPDLSALKHAANFLLEWLKEYYWEVEKEEMKDIVIKRSRENSCKENIEFYLSTYAGLSDILCKESDSTLKKLDNEEFMYSLFDINKRSGFQCAIECIPWITHSRDSFARLIPTENLLSMKLSKYVHLLLQQFHDYVTKPDFWGVDAIPFIVDHMKSDYIYCNRNRETVLGKWKTLILRLNDWKILDRLMLSLCSNDNINNEACILFFNEINKAVTKRHLFDKLKSELSSTFTVSADINEQDIANDIALKKQLNLPPTANEKLINSKLFSRVEKKHIRLKKSPQLTNPVDYLVDKCIALELIKMLTINPSKTTLDNLNYLFILVKPNFSESRKENIRDLIMIKLGLKPATKLNFDSFITKNVSDLEQKYGKLSKTSINNNLEMEIDEECPIVRSGWDFSSCPLGASPWELEGVDYYSVPYDHSAPPKNKIFPLSA